MQAARGGIGLALELAARMEGGQDHLQRRLAGEFGVRIDRDAAAIVGDGKAIARLQRHFDPVGVARDRFVHAVVEHFAGQMMQRALVGAADIHAGSAADRLQPFKHFDGGGIVIGRGGRGGCEQVIGHDGNL